MTNQETISVEHPTLGKVTFSRQTKRQIEVLKEYERILKAVKKLSPSKKKV